MMTADEILGMSVNDSSKCQNIGSLQQKLSACQMTLTQSATKTSNGE